MYRAVLHRPSRSNGCRIPNKDRAASGAFQGQGRGDRPNTQPVFRGCFPSWDAARAFFCKAQVAQSPHGIAARDFSRGENMCTLPVARSIRGEAWEEKAMMTLLFALFSGASLQAVLF